MLHSTRTRCPSAFDVVLCSAALDACGSSADCIQKGWSMGGGSWPKFSEPKTSSVRVVWRLCRSDLFAEGSEILQIQTGKCSLVKPATRFRNSGAA